jgi:Dolichyl-phosphate-mannose-protein mannosyltransferase
MALQNLSHRFFHAAALVLILGSSAARVVYLAHDCPLDLAPDEAHYWDWSRHLDWSYYSKGPLVAYLIRLGTSVAGKLSEQIMGNEMLAVRLPAVACGALMLAGLYVLTLRVYQRPALALLVVVFALTLPPVAAGSSLMTIDAPYACCWTWGLVLGHVALERGRWPEWLGLGVIVGIGILAKYTMVLWWVSLIIYLLTDTQRRAELCRPRLWSAVAASAVCSLPILIWNFQHDWVSYRHVSGQAGLTDSPALIWLGPLRFVAIQFLLFLGYWFVAWAAAMVVHRPTVERDAGVRYLWWMSAPMFVVFMLFSLKTREEPNWPITAYISGLILASAWLVATIQASSGWARRASTAGVFLACAAGLTLIVILHRTERIQSLLASVSGPISRQHPQPLRRFDPTCRLRGWRMLADEIDRMRAELRSKGGEAVLAASGWNLPGEIAFYCTGKPEVYSLGLALGDRHSQYDLWHPNPVEDPGPFLGRTFIFVGEPHPLLLECFDKVEPAVEVIYRENGQPISEWEVMVCRGFRGFRNLPEWKGVY